MVERYDQVNQSAVCGPARASKGAVSWRNVAAHGNCPGCGEGAPAFSQYVSHGTSVASTRKHDVVVMCLRVYTEMSCKSEIAGCVAHAAKTNEEVIAGVLDTTS